MANPPLALLILTVMAIMIRRLPVLFRAFSLARELPAADDLFRLEPHSIALIPIWAEAEAARAAWEFWSALAAKTGVSFRLVISTDDQPTRRTLETLIAAGSPTGGLIQVPGSSKAALLSEAMRGLDPKWSVIALFDSDSRPKGKFELLSATAERALVVTSPSVYEVSGSALTRGSALWHTCWSLGFEQGMSKRRAMSYLVGHGLLIHRRNLVSTGLDASALAEDLMLGYALGIQNKKSHVTTSSSACDISQWPENLASQESMVARWFWGDVQACWRMRSRRPFRAPIRIVELVISWALGPLLLFGSAAAAATTGSTTAASIGLAAVASLVVAPAFLPAPALPAGASLPERALLAVGLMAQPLLDTFAIARHARKVFGTAGTRPPTVKRVPPSVAELPPNRRASKGHSSAIDPSGQPRQIRHRESGT